MTDKLRIRIAAGVTALFLAAISAAGLAVRHDAAPSDAAGLTATPAAQPAATVEGAQRVVAPRSDDDERSDEEGGEHD